jgi:hypothetical protein
MYRDDLDENQGWLFEDGFQHLDELGSDDSIHDSVIATEAYSHYLADRYFTVGVYDRASNGCSNG